MDFKRYLFPEKIFFMLKKHFRLKDKSSKVREKLVLFSLNVSIVLSNCNFNDKIKEACVFKLTRYLLEIKSWRVAVA
jgi:hypothetical protein